MRIGKRPRNSKVSQDLSMIVVCLHPSYDAQFLCQESVNRNQDSNKFSPGAPTPKRPNFGMNYGKRRARRREGARAKALECAIAATCRSSFVQIKSSVFNFLYSFSVALLVSHVYCLSGGKGWLSL